MSDAEAFLLGLQSRLQRDQRPGRSRRGARSPSPQWSSTSPVPPPHAVAAAEAIDGLELPDLGVEWYLQASCSAVTLDGRRGGASASPPPLSEAGLIAARAAQMKVVAAAATASKRRLPRKGSAAPC